MESAEPSPNELPWRASAPVREGYDRWSAVYDDDGNPMVALEQRWFDALLGAVEHLDVLDLGCGTGRHALRLSAAGARVTGIDLSPGMLARARAEAARRGLPSLTLGEHDLHRPLPFANGSFDRVVSGLVLEHLEDLGAFYREVARVLRPGGHAVVSTIHPAMALRAAQARFTDPATGEVVHVQGRPQSFAELVVPALRAGLQLHDVQEHAPDAELAAAFPRAAKYLGWPMLLLLRFDRA
ncbi:MAG: class I SAM-dependent methyltransferase [Planctomycetota bacterium]